MKPFNLEEAKAGKPVCTRDGKPVRIICWDAKGDNPIVALMEDGKGESTIRRPVNGLYYRDEMAEMPRDLMMATIQHTKWVNIYKSDNFDHIDGAERIIWDTKEKAVENAFTPSGNWIGAFPVVWEE